MKSDKSALRRDFGRLLCVTAVVMPILACLFLLKAVPIYEAVTRIEIDRVQENLLRLELASGTSQEESTYLQTQYRSPLSRTLITSVIEDLRLDRDLRYAKKLDIVRAVADDISVVPVPLSRLVDIKVKHPDPRVATNIANTLVRHYIEWNVDRKTGVSLKNLDKLRDEATREAKKFETAERALAEYQNAHGFLPLDQDQSPAAETLTHARVAYAAAQSRTRKARDIVAAIEHYTASGKSITTFPLIASDAILGQVELQTVSLEADLAGLRKAHGDEALDVQQVRARIDATKAAVDGIAQARLEALKAEINLAEVDERAQAANVREWENRFSEWNSAKIDYDVLQVNAESAKALYKDVLLSMKETELNSRNKINNIAVVDVAHIPLKPVSPRIILTLGSSLLIGFCFLGMGWWLRGGTPGSSSGAEPFEGAVVPAH